MGTRTKKRYRAASKRKLSFYDLPPYLSLYITIANKTDFFPDYGSGFSAIKNFV